jgi:hypothetical protein
MAGERAHESARPDRLFYDLLAGTKRLRQLDLEVTARGSGNGG